MIRLEHTVLVAIPPLLRDNLLIADAFENLPVTGVSDSAVPTWNMRSDNYFKALFTFAHSNLHDVAVILIIHSAKPQILKDL